MLAFKGYISIHHWPHYSNIFNDCSLPSVGYDRNSPYTLVPATAFRFSTQTTLTLNFS
jgi:hypothetical protein